MEAQEYVTFPSNDVANNVHADGKKESSKISDNIYCTIFNLADPIPAYTKLCLMPLMKQYCEFIIYKIVNHLHENKIHVLINFTPLRYQYQKTWKTVFN